jgi:hypothetical protein
MDAATINAKIWAGRAKAAQRVGYPFILYRPLTATAPLGNLITTLPAAFNAADNTYQKPNLYGKAIWYTDVDGSRVQIGDYLVNAANATELYFVVARQSLLPIAVVECNATLSIFRPTSTTGQVGAGGYGGETLAGDTMLVNAYPCSLLQGSKGDKSLVNLPGDVRTPWWVVLLPPIPGVAQLMNDDIAFDQMGKRYKLSSCELTDMGWRMTAVEAMT